MLSTSADLTQRLSRIGSLQVSVLRHLALQTPAFADSLERYRGSVGLGLSAVERAAQGAGQQLLQRRARELDEHERLGVPTPPDHKLAVRGDRPDIPWSVPELLGRPPSASERANYSAALRKLEGRGLVTRIDSTRGKGDFRTFRVRLTPNGVRAAVHLSTLARVEAMKAEGVVFEESDS